MLFIIRKQDKTDYLFKLAKIIDFLPKEVDILSSKEQWKRYIERNLEYSSGDRFLIQSQRRFQNLLGRKEFIEMD